MASKKTIEEIFVISSLYLFIQGYIYNNLTSWILGLGLLLYLLLVKISFNPKLTIDFNNINKREYSIDDKINISFKIKNNSKIPINISIINNNSNFKWDFSRETIEKNQSIIYTVSLSPKKTGEQLIKNFVFKINDINNIYYKKKYLNNKISLKIYPSLNSLKIQDKITKNIKLGRKLLGNIIKNQGIEFEELRDYSIGDSPNTIDWKTSFKKDKLIVKKYLDESEDYINILLDVSSDFRREITNNKSKIKDIIFLINKIIYYVNNNKIKYNIILFDNNNVKEIINGNNPDNLKRIYNYMKPVKGHPNLNFKEKNNFQLINHLNKIINGETVICITDCAIRYDELIKLNSLLKNKSSLYVISFNPILYYTEDQLNNEKLVKLYNKYNERKEIVEYLNYYCPTIDLKPNELFGKL